MAAVASRAAMAYLHLAAYAVQAEEELPSSADTAMERVAATRVEQWKAQSGLLDPTDFKLLPSPHTTVLWLMEDTM